ncbi:MAG: hypothetical protein HQK91_04580 [Nitrospirae bacterium]|nr:hypothetical protein [Nitrospirota bacterium]
MKKIIFKSLIFLSLIIYHVFFVVTLVFGQDSVKDGKTEYITVIFPLEDLRPTEETKGMGIEIADTLTSVLSKKSGYKVVERQMLSKIIEELNLNASGVIDPDSAVKAGKLLGANALIMGSFLKFMDQVKINIRLVETETGAILKTASIKGRFNDILDLEEKLVNTIASSDK